MYVELLFSGVRQIPAATLFKNQFERSMSHTGLSQSGFAETDAFPAAPESSLRIKFCGPIYGASGYSELSRACVLALHNAGIPLQVEATRFDPCCPELGEQIPLLRQLEFNRIDYNVKILNLTPEQCVLFREPGCINIAYTMFETDRIPHEWVESCNQLDGVIVPSNWCRQVFESSGVRVPLWVAPPGIDVDAFSSDHRGEGLQELPQTVHRQFARDLHPTKSSLWNWLGIGRGKAASRPGRMLDLQRAFKFYSIFQWSERNNPRGLLEAYFAEFHRDENVCLVLKTYGRDFSPAQGKWVRQQVEAVRQSISLPSYPPVLLITEMLSREEICQLHTSCDCFILPHRSKGLGLPLLEAMAAGNPLITTRYSGNTDFTRDDNSLLLPYQLTPVFNMNWSRWYRGDMMWAEPDLAALRTRMRQVHEDRELARQLGNRGRDFVRAEFNWDRRLDIFLSAVRDIAARRQ